MSSNKPKAVPVSELFDRLVSELGGVQLPHSVLFQAALRVCAEDSKRIQRGEPPAQVWALVQRAREVLAASHPSAFPPSETAWGAPSDGESSGIRFSGLRPSPPADEAPLPDDEGGALVPPAPSPDPDDLPSFEPVAAPRGPVEDEETPPAAAPEPSLPAPADAPLPTVPEPLAPGSGAEPVSPVLKLTESAVSFQDLFPEEGESGAEADQVGSPQRRPLLFRSAIVAVALLAAAVAVVILWPGVAPRPQGPSRIVESYPAPQATAVPTAAAPVALATAAPTVPAPSAPAAAPRAGSVPTAAAPSPPRVAPGRAATAPEPVRPARPVEAEGVETMRSPDWAGHEATFVVHFASYRSRDNAVADAARLGRELGRPVHALVVDLGDKGTWYRVVVGDFASADDARSFRAQVAARRTGDVGGVDRLAAP